MKKSTLSILILLSLLLIFFFIYKNRKTQESNTVYIAAILALTGKSSVVGNGELIGIKMAIDSLNNLNNGLKYTLLIEDNKSNPKDAVSAFNKLVTTYKIDFLISSQTAIAEALTPLIDKKGIIHFCISPDMKIVEKSKYNYRIYYSFKTEANRIIEFVKAKNIKSLSYLGVNYSSFVNMVEYIKTDLTKSKIAFNSIEYFDLAALDFKNQVLKIKQAGTEAVLLAPMPNQIENLNSEMLNSNMKNIKIGSFSYNWKGNEFLSKNNLGYNIVTPIFQTTSTESKIYKYFKNKYNSNPNFDIMFAFDNIMIMGMLIKDSNSDKGVFNKLFNSLGKYQGASGDIVFIGNNDTDVSATIKEY